MGTSFTSKKVTVHFGSKANKTWSRMENLSIKDVAQQLRVHQYRNIITVLIDGQALSGRQFYALLRKNGVAYKFDIEEALRYSNDCRR